MRERAGMPSGTPRVSSRPGDGARVGVRGPLDGRPQNSGKGPASLEVAEGFLPLRVRNEVDESTCH